MRVDIIIDAAHLIIHEESCKALLLLHLKLASESSVLWENQRRKKQKLIAFGKFEHLIDDILHGMLLHFLITDRREDMSYSGIKQSEVFVYLGRCADRTSRIAAYYLLLDGNGRRKSFDEVAFRFAHSAKKLSGIGRQALYISALTFSIESVESK